MGLGDPLATTNRLERVLQGIKRCQASKASTRPPRLPVTRDLMLRIHSLLNLTTADDAMLWAAFCTAWFGFLRVSEFTTPPSGFDPSVHLSISDLAVDRLCQASGVLLVIKASKTDPYRQGVNLFLPRTGGVLCPVDSLSNYLHHRCNGAGPLFLFSDGTPLSRLHVTNRLRSLLAQAGVQGNFSSHSFPTAPPLLRMPRAFQTR